MADQPEPLPDSCQHLPSGGHAACGVTAHWHVGTSTTTAVLCGRHGTVWQGQAAYREMHVIGDGCRARTCTLA